MSVADSSAVPGAMLIIAGSRTYTDATGHYEFSKSYSGGETDPLEIRLIASDVDGESNGVFVSKDTLVSVEGMAHIQEITLNVNLYVEMVENTSNLLPPRD